MLDCFMYIVVILFRLYRLFINMKAYSQKKNIICLIQLRINSFWFSISIILAYIYVISLYITKIFFLSIILEVILIICNILFNNYSKYFFFIISPKYFFFLWLSIKITVLIAWLLYQSSPNYKIVRIFFFFLMYLIPYTHISLENWNWK